MSYSPLRTSTHLLSWGDINFHTDRSIIPVIKGHNRITLQVQKLTQEVFEGMPARNASKVLFALQHRKIPILLFQQLTTALVEKGILLPHAAAAYINHQPTLQQELENAIQKENAVEVIRLITIGQTLPVDSDYNQDLLNLLSTPPYPSDKLLMQYINILLDQGCVLPEQALNSLIFLTDLYHSNPEARENYLNRIVLLSRQPDVILPITFHLRKTLLHILCCNVAPGDFSLYPVIRKLFLELSDFDIPINEKHHLDFFIENGGNVGELFFDMNKEDLEDFSAPYLALTTEEEFSEQVLGYPGSFIAACTDDTVRNTCLSLPNLDFLKGNILTALAQFCSFPIDDGDDDYTVFIYGLFQKFNSLQQNNFLESLTPSAQEKVQAVAMEKNHHFVDEKKDIINQLNLILHPSVELSEEQRGFLNNLYLSISGKVPSIFEEAEQEVLRPNVTPFQLTQAITRVTSQISYLSLWINNPLLKNATVCLREILASRISGSKENEARQYSECNAVLSTKELDTLKYLVAQKAIQKYVLEGQDWTTLDIDLDDLVAKGYEGLITPPCPGKESEEYQAWQIEVQRSLEVALTYHLHNKPTLEDVNAWLTPPVVSNKENLPHAGALGSPQKRKHDDSNSPRKRIALEVDNAIIAGIPDHQGVINPGPLELEY